VRAMMRARASTVTEGARGAGRRGRWPGAAALALVCGLLSLSGCPESSSCQGLGEPCQLLCCGGLNCSDTGYGFRCTKSCQCHGSGLCASTQFQEGCPQGSACFVEPGRADGKGTCVQLCDTSPCQPGQVLCDTTDGGAECHEVPAADMLAPPG